MYETYFEHHGIKGQKWGVRRYQNEDSSLTEEGKKRYLESPRMKKMREKNASKKEYKNYATEKTINSAFHAGLAAVGFIFMKKNDISLKSPAAYTSYINVALSLYNANEALQARMRSTEIDDIKEEDKSSEGG